MSLAERGSYIGLLATAWGEEMPGTLPATEDIIRRLAEMSPDDWKVSGPVLLAMFPLSDCGSYRYNPRLLEEAGKREELSEKKAEAGRKSAERRARLATEGQQSGNTIPTGVEITATGVAKKGNQLQSQLQLQAKAVVDVATATAPEALPAKKPQHPGQLLTNPDDEQHWSVGPLTKPNPFRILCERLGFLEVDFEHYRKQALVAAEDADISRTISQWSSWIRNYFNNQLKGGPLLKAAAVDLSRSTPKDQLPPAGTDCTGRHIVLPNTGDANMNRMFAANYARDYPNATIHTTR